MRLDDSARRYAAMVSSRVLGADLVGRTARYAVPGRLSGSEELESVLARVGEDLRGLGMVVHEERVRVLTSRPGRALVRIGATIYPGQSAAFAGPVAESRGAAVAAATVDHQAWPDRVVVVHGLPRPDLVALAEASGARALVALVGERGPCLVSVSPVWGSPTPWTVGNLPALPVAVLSGEVALALGRLLESAWQDGQAPVLTISAGVDTRWRDVPLVTADLAGERDALVLAGAHADAWYEGAMDNAAGMAALVETATAMAASGRPTRALRLAFWPAWEDGGGGGGQAYADSHWQELERKASAYLEVADPGGAGNTELDRLGGTPELGFLLQNAIAEVTDEPWRPALAPAPFDRSFLGVGVASARLGGGHGPGDLPRGPLWHGPGDRVEALDARLLGRDAAVAAHAIAAAAAMAAEPIDALAGARALAVAVGAWQRRLMGRLDLSGAVARSERLVERVETLERAGGRRTTPARADEAAQAMRALGRLLVRLGFTSSGRFEAGSALPLEPLPTLGACESLLGSPPGSAPADLANVAAVRARTAVEVSLDEAIEAAETCLSLGRPAPARR